MPRFMLREARKGFGGDIKEQGKKILTGKNVNRKPY